MTTTAELETEATLMGELEKLLGRAYTFLRQADERKAQAKVVMARGRNDPCFCGCGQKTKKCSKPAELLTAYYKDCKRSRELEQALNSRHA